MKRKLTEIDHERISEAIDDFARKSIKDFWNNKLTWKKRIENGFTGLSIYLFFAVTWTVRNYRWVKEYLRIKLGISIKWVIITLLSAWTLAGILHNTPRY